MHQQAVARACLPRAGMSTISLPAAGGRACLPQAGHERLAALERGLCEKVIGTAWIVVPFFGCPEPVEGFGRAKRANAIPAKAP